MQWQFADDTQEKRVPEKRPSRRWWLLLLLVPVAVTAIILWYRQQAVEARTTLLATVQTQFALEQAAFSRGDGDLFWTTQREDDGWLSAQLHPLNQQIYRQEPIITAATAQGVLIWANLQWTEPNGQTWQRVAFYERQPDGSLLRVPTDPAFWGGTRVANYDWGELVLTAADQEWGAEIAAFVETAVADICAAACLDDLPPLQLTIAPDFESRPVPGIIRVPSPHLLALDEDGRPGEPFWDALQTALVDHLTPATIRFAVPDDRTWLQNYRRAMEAFAEEYPQITIELVMLTDESGRNDFIDLDLALINSFDALAFTPSPELLAAGAVRDLTPFMERDPAFAHGDFFEQIWQGALWYGRSWFVPQAAALPLLFYDEGAFEEAGRPPPTAAWTWTEMAEEMAEASQPGADTLGYGFLAGGEEALYAYAYNWENDCRQHTILCDQQLSPLEINAAFDWLDNMVADGLHPDITQFTPTQTYSSTPYFLLPTRSNLRETYQSARRQAVIWVDWPGEYEFRDLLAPLGVAIFPGSAVVEGVTPLQVYGHFMTAETTRPLPTWQWLAFLSRYPLQAQNRYVPARLSVAREMRFWQNLPPALVEPMRTALPYARPIRLQERGIFTRERVLAVLNEELPKADAATSPAYLWFQP